MNQGRLRHIPVIDSEGHLCGILSQRDLFRGILLRSLGYGSRLEEKLLDSHPIKEAMIENPHVTTPDTAARDAARVMLEHKVGCLPVVEDKKLVGIVTEADFDGKGPPRPRKKIAHVQVRAHVIRQAVRTQAEAKGYAFETPEVTSAPAASSEGEAGDE